MSSSLDAIATGSIELRLRSEAISMAAMSADHGSNIGGVAQAQQAIDQDELPLRHWEDDGGNNLD